MYNLQPNSVDTLFEQQVKGGLDNPLDRDENRVLEQQKLVANAFQNSGLKGEKDYNFYVNTMSIQQFVPKNGYLPVRLVNRGLSIIEKSFAQKNPQMTKMQRLKRPRYTLDPALDAKTDELYREVIRPRQQLLDSEELAYKQLKQAAGIRTGRLAQLPLTDEQSDAVFKMADAFQTYAKFMRGRTGDTFAAIDSQQMPAANSLGEYNSVYDDQTYGQVQQQIAKYKDEFTKNPELAMDVDRLLEIEEIDKMILDLQDKDGLTKVMNLMGHKGEYELDPKNVGLAIGSLEKKRERLMKQMKDQARAKMAGTIKEELDQVSGGNTAGLWNTVMRNKRTAAALLGMTAAIAMKSVAPQIMDIGGYNQSATLVQNFQTAMTSATTNISDLAQNVHHAATMPLDTGMVPLDKAKLQMPKVEAVPGPVDPGDNKKLSDQMMLEEMKTTDIAPGKYYIVKHLQQKVPRQQDIKEQKEEIRQEEQPQKLQKETLTEQQPDKLQKNMSKELPKELAAKNVDPLTERRPTKADWVNKGLREVTIVNIDEDDEEMNQEDEELKQNFQSMQEKNDKIKGVFKQLFEQENKKPSDRKKLQNWLTRLYKYQQDGLDQVNRQEGPLYQKWRRETYDELPIIQKVEVTVDDTVDAIRNNKLITDPKGAIADILPTLNFPYEYSTETISMFDQHLIKSEPIRTRLNEIAGNSVGLGVDYTGYNIMGAADHLKQIYANGEKLVSHVSPEWAKDSYKLLADTEPAHGFLQSPIISDDDGHELKKHEIADDPRLNRRFLGMVLAVADNNYRGLPESELKIRNFIDEALILQGIVQRAPLYIVQEGLGRMTEVAVGSFPVVLIPIIGPELPQLARTVVMHGIGSIADKYTWNPNELVKMAKTNKHEDSYWSWYASRAGIQIKSVLSFVALYYTLKRFATITGSFISKGRNLIMGLTGMSEDDADREIALMAYVGRNTIPYSKKVALGIGNHMAGLTQAAVSKLYSYYKRVGAIRQGQATEEYHYENDTPYMKRMRELYDPNTRIGYGFDQHIPYLYKGFEQKAGFFKRFLGAKPTVAEMYDVFKDLHQKYLTFAFARHNVHSLKHMDEVDKYIKNSLTKIKKEYGVPVDFGLKVVDLLYEDMVQEIGQEKADMLRNNPNTLASLMGVSQENENRLRYRALTNHAKKLQKQGAPLVGGPVNQDAYMQGLADGSLVGKDVNIPKLEFYDDPNVSKDGTMLLDSNSLPVSQMITQPLDKDKFLQPWEVDESENPFMDNDSTTDTLSAGLWKRVRKLSARDKEKVFVRDKIRGIFPLQ